MGMGLLGSKNPTSTRIVSTTPGTVISNFASTLRSKVLAADRHARSQGSRARSRVWTGLSSAADRAVRFSSQITSRARSIYAEATRSMGIFARRRKGNVRAVGHAITRGAARGAGYLRPNLPDIQVRKGLRGAVPWREFKISSGRVIRYPNWKREEWIGVLVALLYAAVVTYVVLRILTWVLRPVVRGLVGGDTDARRGRSGGGGDGGGGGGGRSRSRSLSPVNEEEYVVESIETEYVDTPMGRKVLLNRVGPTDVKGTKRRAKQANKKQNDMQMGGYESQWLDWWEEGDAQ